MVAAGSVQFAAIKVQDIKFTNVVVSKRIFGRQCILFLWQCDYIVLVALNTLIYLLYTCWRLIILSVECWNLLKIVCVITATCFGGVGGMEGFLYYCASFSLLLYVVASGFLELPIKFQKKILKIPFPTPDILLFTQVHDILLALKHNGKTDIQF